MSAKVPKNGPTQQLDTRPEPEEQVTEEQVQDPSRLARFLMTLLRDVATLKRRFIPTFIDFEDITVDATGLTRYRFSHNFGGRVRWYVIDWAGGAGPAMLFDGTSDDNTLVLVSVSAGIASIRVEKAG